MILTFILLLSETFWQMSKYQLETHPSGRCKLFDYYFNFPLFIDLELCLLFVSRLVIDIFT